MTFTFVTTVLCFFLDKYTITAMSLLGSQVWSACLAFKHRRYNAVGVHALAQVCFCRLKQGGQLRPCNGSVQGNLQIKLLYFDT